jgi:hypothetical protein
MADQRPPDDDVVDLTAILEQRGPRRRARIDASKLALSRFGIGELLELTRIAGVPPDELGAALRTGSGDVKGRLVVGLAWLIARRGEPGLTYDDVATWELEVVSTPSEDPTRPARNERGTNGSSPSGARRGSRRVSSRK